MNVTSLTFPVTGFLAAQSSAHATVPLGQHLGQLASAVGTAEVPGPGPDNGGGSVGFGTVCPQAPPGAEGPTNELTGYVLWGVLILFVMGLVIGLGAVVAGRVFAMPHASKAGVVGLVVVFIAAVAYLVLPSMLDGILGDGCI